MVAPEHLLTASASCWNVQLHAIVEETVMLLPRALVLVKQHCRNAVVLSRKHTGETWVVLASFAVKFSTGPLQMTSSRKSGGTYLRI